MQNTNNQSLLTEERITELLEGQKHAFEREGVQNPILMVMFESGLLVFTSLTDSRLESDEKYTTMRKIGLYWRRKHGRMIEALYIAGTWMLSTKTPDLGKVPISEHPDRKAALSIYGRNYDRSRSVYAIQPFSLDEEGTPIWQTPKVDFVVGQSASHPGGILDDLFLGAS